MRRGPTMAIVGMVVLGACGDDRANLRPYIEVPDSSSPAYPYEGLDELELAIAREGDDAPLALATAAPGEPLELLDVPFGDDLVVHLSGKAAGVEIAYGRTCAIDVPAGSTPQVPEPRLYFARIVRWGQRLDAPAALAGGGAWPLPDGRIAMTGRSGRIAIFDPLASGAFALLEPSLLERDASLVLPLPGGAALAVGGVDGDGNALTTVELIAPTAETVGRQVEVYAGGPGVVDHAGAALVDGTVVVAGGRAQTQPGQPLVATDAAWLLEIGAGGVLEAPELLAARLASPRAGHTMTRLGDEVGADVLVVGGVDASGLPVATTELYRPLREAFEAVDGALLTTPRHAHRAVRMPGGFVLVIGGLSRTGDGEPAPQPSLELYDPVQGVFTSAGSLPAGAGVTELSVTPLADGRVLLAGGRDVTGEPVAATLIARLDPLDGRVDVIPTAPLEVPRAGHTALALCDGTILVVGGTDDSDAAERYNPPSVGRRRF